VTPAAGRAEVLDLMQARTLEQIPVVNADGTLGGLHLMHEVIGTVERPNWAVIMAGGKGVRLRPITEHLPKPMIPVAGRPILERLVLHLVGSGVRRIFLAINYLGHLVENHFGNGSRFGCHIEYLREQQPLGTGGALRLLPEPPPGPMLVMNGDLVTQVDVGALLDYHRQGGHVATMGVRLYAHTVPFGCVETRAGRITELVEKPDLTRLINTGLYVLNPALIERVPADQEFPITDLFTGCLERGESVGAYELIEDWIDVGQREQLRQAREGAA
jgi:NDP-sugar pyrophosphorylase family protein